jgi:hypothetical protein
MLMKTASENRQAASIQPELAVKFFGSALSDSGVPEFNPEAPDQAGLVFEGSDEQAGVV